MQKNIIGKTVKAKLPRKQRKYTDKDYAPIEKWIEKKVKGVNFKTLDEFKDFIRKDFVKGKGEGFINSSRGEKNAEKYIEKEKPKKSKEEMKKDKKEKREERRQEKEKKRTEKLGKSKRIKKEKRLAAKAKKLGKRRKR